MERIRFMNIFIDNVTKAEAVDFVRRQVEAKRLAYIVTPNTDHMVKLQRDADFRAAYAKAGLAVVDGTPVMLAAKLYHTPLKEKIPGPELTEAIIAEASARKYRVFFLGGRPGVAELAAKKLQAKYPGFVIAGTYAPPMGFEKDPAEIEAIVKRINDASPDIIIAGMGSPKTEILLANICDDLNSGVSLSSGAAIDFFAGAVKRCPAWVNRIGMEWFYRFLQEPRRLFKRYFIDDVEFLWLILKYRGQAKLEYKNGEDNEFD